MLTNMEDPFAAYNASLDEPKKLREAVAAQGTYGTPEVTAKAFGLSEKVGVTPLEALEPDAFDLYNQSLKMPQAEAMAGTKTGKWLLKDPLHVDLTGGKFDPFLALEDKHSSAEAARVNAENEKSGRSWITGMAASIGYGAANLAGSPMDLARTVANAVFSTDTANAVTKVASYTPMGLIAEQNQKVAKWLETKKRATENIQFADKSINWGAVNPTTLHGAENIANMVASEAVPMLAQYVLGSLAAPATGGASLAATTAANAGKLQKVGMFAKAVVSYAKSPVSAVNAMRVVTGQAQQGVQELMGDGLTEDQAWQKVAPGALLAGLFSVAAGSPMEAKIMEDMFSKVASAPGANGVMRKITTRFSSFISMGAKEGAQEVLEGIGEDLAAFITYQPDKTVKDFAANAIMNFVGGAAMGGVMGASLHGSQALQHARNADFIYALHDEKARMEFTKHAPGKMAEFVNDLTKDGSLMSLPVDANGFNRFYQSQGMTAEDARTFAVEKLGVVAADYDMALQNNGDLIIPTGNYAQHIAGNENFEGIFEVTRAAQGGPMMKDLQEQHINEQDLQSMQKAMAEMPVTDPQRDMVRDEIAAMLKPATRVFTPAQVTDIADQFARVLTITAAKGKTTATELLAKNKLQIERQFESMETTKATNEGRTLSPAPTVKVLNELRGEPTNNPISQESLTKAAALMSELGIDPAKLSNYEVATALETSSSKPQVQAFLDLANSSTNSTATQTKVSQPVAEQLYNAEPKEAYDARDPREAQREASLSQPASDGAGNEGQPWTFRRGIQGAGGSLRVLGVAVHESWGLEPAKAAELQAQGISTPAVHELDFNDSSAAAVFKNAIEQLREGNRFAAAVHVYDLEDYASMRLFLTEDGKAGFALKPDGDIISVFARKDGQQGASHVMLEIAKQAGGVKLDCFDTVLPAIYAQHGFKATSRMAWNDEYAPEDWSKETFSKFNDGEPDVVFMAYAAGAAAYTKQDGVLTDDYDLALQMQSDAVSALSKTKLFQTATVREGKETLKKFGLDPDKTYSVRQVAAALEARQQKKYGAIARTDRSPESAKKIGKWMVEEVAFEMQHPEKSGVGWYSEKFQRALDVFSEEFPELKADKNARSLLTALIAVTSDGQSVVPNFQQAVDLYGNYRSTGKFTTERGHMRQASIDNNVRIITELLSKMQPEEMVSYLLNEATVSDLKKIAKVSGIDFSTDYQAHIKLPMAAVVFGPKLGAFYANLMGAEGYLTMDRWWSRTFNRYRGALLPEPTRQGTDRIKSLMGDPAMLDSDALEATKVYRKSYEAKNFKNGTELEKAANTIWKAAFGELEDAPFNASDRTFMLDTVAEARKQLKRKGVTMSVADIQATLWYYEKRLYGELGARQSQDVSYEEAAHRVIESRLTGSAVAGGPSAQGNVGASPEAGAAGISQAVTDLEDDSGGVTRLNQPAYHGTPYRFDKFSLEHMGKGEGAQAFGWGLYFAGNKDLAEWYMRTLAGKKDAGREQSTIDGKTLGEWKSAPERQAIDAMNESNFDIPTAIDYLEGMGKKAAAKVLLDIQEGRRTFEKREGQLYKVEIPEDATMLLWDKPLSEQPAEVRRSLLVAFPWLTDRAKAESLEIDQLLEGLGEAVGAPSKLELPLRQASDFYGDAARRLGSDEAASKALGAAGISGIKYLAGTSRAAGEGDYNYVVFDDAAISIMETYYQQPTTGARGYLEFGTAANGQPRQFKLALLEAENKSTVFHELGHFYLELLGDMSEDARADQAIKDDYAAILKWFGVESRSQITTEMHEQFADGHLAYLLEGKAPTPELASSFTKFSKWLSKIGQQLLGVDVNMTDEVRGIFDRLYASETEIEAAKKQSQLQMFTTAEQAGMSQAEFNVYKKAVQKEWETAQEKLTQQLMKELDREQQREYRDEFEKTRAQVDAEILARPEYAALKALSDGHLSDDPMNPTEVKLSRQALVAKYGEKLPGQLARDTNYVYTTEGGMDADAAAMTLGWNSGDELVQALTGLEGRNVVVDRLTKSRMEEAHPTLMGNAEALREQATTLLNGEQLERRLATELRSLQKLRSKAKPIVALAVGELQSAEAEAKKDLVTPKAALLRASAKAFIEGKQAFTIRPDIFRADMLRAGKEAFKLLAKKDYAGASKAKEQEMLSHFLYLEAVKAKDEADGFRTFVKRNDSATVRGKMGKAGGTFLAQFDDLRDRFSIEREPAKELARRESLATWAEKQGLESNDVVVADWLMDERQTLNYQELTLTQLRDLRDALKNIKHLAYLQLGTIIDGKHVAYEDMMEEFETTFAKIPHDKTTLLRASDIRRDTTSARTGAMLQGLEATLVKIEQLVNWIDGNDVKGPAHKFIWDRIAKAQYADHKLSVELNRPLIAAMEAMPREQRESLSTEAFDIGMVDGDGKPSPVSRAEILTMLLYNGQTTRREKLLAGYASRGLNERTMQAAFSRLKAEDFAFAKTIWATFDTMQPMILDLEERLTGIRPQWEPATPFEVYDDEGRFLAQLPGGYFPLVADPKLTGELGKKQEGGTVQQVMGGNGYSRASTSKGHTKELTGKTYPLLLNYHQTLTAELSNQIKDLTHREVVLSVNKILSNDRFSTLMKEHIGEPYEAQLQPWLVNVVSDRNAGASRGLSAVSSAIATARANVVAAVLGFKFSSMIVQFADLSRIVAPGDYRVSVKHLTSAYADLIGNRSKMVEMIKELSPEMAQREQNLDRDLRDRLDNLRGQHGPVAKWNRAAFSGLSMMDSIVSWPVWLGSYQQSMALHGDQERAAREADRTVRMLLMTGAPKDLTPLQADKNPFYKAITMFMGDATSNYNSLRNAGHNINGLKGIPTFTGALVAVMLGAIFGDWLKGQWPEEDTGEWMARKAALAPLGTMPVVRDVANLYDNVLSGKPFTDYKFSPAFTSIQKVFVDPVIHTKKLYDGTEEIGDYAINMLESAGYALGVGGTAQAKGTIKFLKRYFEGAETADNPVKFTYDVVSGKKKEKR